MEVVSREDYRPFFCYRLLLGPKNVHAEECFAGDFVGIDFDVQEDLASRLPDTASAFIKDFAPIWSTPMPTKASRAELASWKKAQIAAALAFGDAWTVCKGMKKGDILLCPDNTGQYRVAKIDGRYTFAPGEILQHRRPVRWLPQTISQVDLDELRINSGDSAETVVALGGSSWPQPGAVEYLLQQSQQVAKTAIASTDHTTDDPLAFALEKHLEDFLVQNWHKTELSREFDIYEEDGDLIGQQFPTDTGPIDIFAISKDRKTLLVVELKKGRASDVVVGQLLRYMGYVQDELAEREQAVRGVVIALEDDHRLARALAAVPTIDFYRYEVDFSEVNFKLVKD